MLRLRRSRPENLILRTPWTPLERTCFAVIVVLGLLLIAVIAKADPASMLVAIPA